MMSFEPIQDQRLSDRIAERFIRDMRNGDLIVGMRLPPENQLADQLGVSRGILREALTILEARGFISRAPKGGTFIKSVAGDDFARALSGQLKQATYRDLLEFREVMECKAVEKIVAQATDEQLDALSDLLVEVPQEAEAATQLDRYFHYRIAELSGNQLFSSFIDAYYELIREIKERTVRTDDRRASILHEHKAIVNALYRRDVSAAQQAVRDHLNAVRCTLERNRE